MSQAEKLAKTLKHISHPLRLLMICMLSEGEKSAGDIVARLGTTKGNISQHLRILSDNGVISHRKDANRVIYRIVDAKIAKLLEAMRSLYCPGGR